MIAHPVGSSGGCAGNGPLDRHLAVGRNGRVGGLPVILRLPVRVGGDYLPSGTIGQLDCQEGSLQAQVVSRIRTLEPDADKTPRRVRPLRIRENFAEFNKQGFVIKDNTWRQGDLHRLEVRRALDGTAGSTTQEILAEPRELLNVSIESVCGPYSVDPASYR